MKALRELWQCFLTPTVVCDRPWKRALFVLLFIPWVCLVIALLGWLMIISPLFMLWEWIRDGDKKP